MHPLAHVLIVLTAGFTASAIVSNIYRIVGASPETTSGDVVRVLVLLFAGPSEIFESAIDARLKGQWSATWFWLTISMVCYWSLVLGIIVLQVARALAA